MRVEERRAEPEVLEDYRRLYETARGATPFHSPEWLECCLRIVPSSELTFLAVEDGGHTRGMMPVVTKRIGPVTSVFSLPYGTYGGFLFYEPEDISSLAAELSRLVSPKQGIAELVDYGGTLPELPSFELEPRMCHVLDLRDGYEVIWQTRYDRTQRKTQRSARSKGLEAKEIQTYDDLEAFHRLYAATYQEKGSHVFPLEDLRFMFEKLTPPGIFRGLLALHEGNPVAGTVSLFHPEVTVGFLQGSSRAHRSLRAVNLLIDEAIRDAIRKGGRTYNLGVTPKGADGVRKFKESFGAVRKDFTVQVKRELLFKLKSKLRG